MRTLADLAAFQELATRIDALTPADEPRWGRMNAYQMLRHVADAVRVPLGERQTAVRKSLLLRTLVKWGGLWFPMQWPHGIPAPPELDQHLLGVKDGDFESARQEAVRLLGCLRASDADGMVHCYFGHLSQLEWMRWGWLHTDHHLRQFGR